MSSEHGYISHDAFIRLTPLTLRIKTPDTTFKLSSSDFIRPEDRTSLDFTYVRLFNYQQAVEQRRCEMEELSTAVKAARRSSTMPIESTSLDGPPFSSAAPTVRRIKRASTAPVQEPVLVSPLPIKVYVAVRRHKDDRSATQTSMYILERGGEDLISIRHLGEITDMQPIRRNDGRGAIVHVRVQPFEDNQWPYLLDMDGMNDSDRIWLKKHYAGQDRDIKLPPFVLMKNSAGEISLNRSADGTRAEQLDLPIRPAPLGPSRSDHNVESSLENIPHRPWKRPTATLDASIRAMLPLSSQTSSAGKVTKTRESADTRPVKLRTNSTSGKSHGDQIDTPAKRIPLHRLTHSRLASRTPLQSRPSGSTASLPPIGRPAATVPRRATSHPRLRLGSFNGAGLASQSTSSLVEPSLTHPGRASLITLRNKDVEQPRFENNPRGSASLRGKRRKPKDSSGQKSRFFSRSGEIASALLCCPIPYRRKK